VARPRLFWVLTTTYLAIVLVCTVALGWYAVTSARDFYLSHTSRELESRLRLVDKQLGGSVERWRQPDLEALVRELGSVSGTRFTVIATDGKVLADSVASPAAMGNHGDRPEVVAALDGRVGRATRESPTLGVEEMYVAIPLLENGRVAAVLRAAVPLTSVNQALHSLYWRIGISAAVVALASAAIGLLVSRRISRQMRSIQRGAVAYAAGDFGYKLEMPRTVEFGAVVQSLNEMAAQLDEKIRTITGQKSEREAILSSMVEGVLAVDSEDRIITLNAAAARLFAVDRADAERRSLQEVVRNPDLQRLVAQALHTQEPVESEITLRVGGQERVLQVNGTVLRDAEGNGIGAMAVLNDVSRLKALESMRREFVANVSHEIKTPVTSIKGFAETLLDGAMHIPEDAERFLRIIAGQADRLNSIVEDLLSLSQVEQAGEAGGLTLHEASLSDVLHVAVDVCDPKAAAKRITIDVSMVGEIYAPINPPLLEQAVVNLIDNAIKYSPEGAAVEVSCAADGDEVIIAVRDWGAGIAREHLTHLFERFYRVDKARSRDLGGTGLGLAIVKHIAQAHHGRVSVESALGKGSTFRIHLPRG